MNANIFWTKGYIPFIVVFKILSSVYVVKAAKIPPCIDDTVPCMTHYANTMTVCENAPGYSNMSLIVPSDNMTQDINIIAKGEQFSIGDDIAGVFHVGDKDINRWVNRIRRPEQNILTYEIWNARTQYTDEFYCQYELDIGGQKFRSDFFKWFAVEKCPPPSESSMPGKEAQQLNATCEEDPLKNRTENINASASECEELKTMISNLQQNLSELEKYAKKALQRSVHSDDKLEKVLEELGSVNKKMSTNNNRQNISLATNIILILLLILHVLTTYTRIFKAASVLEYLQNKFSRCPVASGPPSGNDQCNGDELPAANESSSSAREQSTSQRELSLITNPSDAPTTSEPIGYQERGQVSFQEMTSTYRHIKVNKDNYFSVQEEMVDGGGNNQRLQVLSEGPGNEAISHQVGIEPGS